MVPPPANGVHFLSTARGVHFPTLTTPLLSCWQGPGSCNLHPHPLFPTVPAVLSCLSQPSRPLLRPSHAVRCTAGFSLVWASRTRPVRPTSHWVTDPLVGTPRHLPWACEIGGSPGFHTTPHDQTQGFACGRIQRLFQIPT